MNKSPNQVLEEYYVGKFYQGRKYTDPEDRDEVESDRINRKIDSADFGTNDSGDAGMYLYITSLAGDQDTIFIHGNEGVYLSEVESE